MVSCVTPHLVTKGGNDYTYADFFGRSDDSKPTTGIFNGATFLEKVVNASGAFANKWRIYIFDAKDLSWNLFVEWDVETSAA